MASQELITVVFADEGLEVEATPGQPLARIIQRSGADVTFGCRQGSCGSCRVRVLQGQENLSPRSREERDFLALLGAESDERLACQLTVNGNCELSYLGG